MSLTDVTITNNNNSRQFLFRGVQPLSRRRDQPAINIPLISTTEANTFLFRFAGQSGILDFTFAIYDDGTDVSAGTHTSTVITVQEQIQYLFDWFFSEDYDVDWTLTQSEFYSSSVTGVITSLNVTASAGTAFRSGTLTFQRGNIGQL